MTDPDQLRFHGAAPFRVVVVHGGPGAGGEMRPVATRLSTKRGVLEPIQTAMSVDGQVDELAEVVRQHAAPPVTLIGYSWGAWLVLLTAAQEPSLVEKLILVSSGPFEAHSANRIMPERLRRLSHQERAEVQTIMSRLNDASSRDDSAFARIGELLGKADAFDPLPDDHSEAANAEIYASVWPEAAELRRSGRLLEVAARLTCPVVAIHGSYDSHPAEGVRVPLSRVLPDVRFVLLEDCGHTPWLERRARAEFYAALERALR